jgi:hypothetical protein
MCACTNYVRGNGLVGTGFMGLSPELACMLIEWASDDQMFSLINNHGPSRIICNASEKFYSVQDLDRASRLDELNAITLAWSEATMQERITILVQWETNL